jgi:flagellin-like hook-associated protein FlgL
LPIHLVYRVTKSAQIGKGRIKEDDVMIGKMHEYSPVNVTLTKSQSQMQRVEKPTDQTGQSTKAASNLDSKIKEAGKNQSGVSLGLSKDALQALRNKSNDEYNKIVNTASAKAGALGEDVINQFRTNALQQAKQSALAQANSSPQAVLSLLN